MRYWSEECHSEPPGTPFWLHLGCSGHHLGANLGRWGCHFGVLAPLGTLKTPFGRQFGPLGVPFWLLQHSKGSFQEQICRSKRYFLCILTNSLTGFRIRSPHQKFPYEFNRNTNPLSHESTRGSAGFAKRKQFDHFCVSLHRATECYTQDIAR